MKKILSILLLPLALSACGRPTDLAYNEQVGATLQFNIRQLHSDHEALLRGGPNAAQAPSRAISLAHADRQLATLETALDQVQQLRHSSLAGEFARNVTTYYEHQITYYRDYQRYLATSDPSLQAEIAARLDATFTDLDARPVQIREAQKAFVGMVRQTAH
ncbi:hypothetical protein HNP46_000851 [Pseudomonas nitritireducens]|uniref:Lipoprotein n=1 Tax=Pseudomonas nitroreducens TaxID=46680 RepID=A0A7W7KGT6_PSENT|nr:hypothetical protein [Pseudomonas nitritireducens]MBB4862014.1 hypothetical protein [Pseudomonas nitritireducens]